MGIVRSSLRLLPALLLCGAVTAGVARADAKADTKCRAAIGKNAASFAQAKLKLLQKCNEGLVKKGLPLGTCPDEKTQAKIDKAKTKTDGAIVKSCAGKDKTCGTGDDAAPGFPGTCPNLENGTCDGAVANCNDIGPCLNDCIGENAIDQAISLYYASLVPSDPKDKAQKPLNKCQIAIGKSAATLLKAESKAIQKCWDTVNKGKVPGPCPPYGADAKTDAAIAKAKQKYDDATCKACSTGKPCDITASAFTRTQIGFPPDCPPVVRPGLGGGTCDFGRTLVSMEDVRDCAECVTEFKVDCLSAAAASGFPNAPAYPAECNVTLPPTPTPTTSPTPSVSPTPTTTATETSTPGPTETATETPTSTAATDTPTPTATSTPGADTCPTLITFTGTSTNGVLDTGWTGNGHDATVISDGTVTVSVSGCDNPSPPCDVCTYSGPVENASGQIHSQRCQGDSSKLCTGDGDCGADAPCKFFFGSYLPLAAGGVSTCVENVFAGGITGTANVDTAGVGAGTSAGTASITSIVFSGPTLSNPCPRCLGDGPANDGTKGGTCDSGLHSGDACDASGSSPNAAFGTTSLDCPPLTGGKIAALPIDLTNTTGTKTRTTTAANPLCRAPGWGALHCQCDTCDTAAAEPCSSDADCPATHTCGGKRCASGTNVGTPCAVNSECPSSACTTPGAATAANQCDAGPGSGDCVADAGTPSPNDRICSSGPFEQFCGPVETFRGCASDGDCGFAGDTCSVGRFRDCFDNGELAETVSATGQADPPSGHQAESDPGGDVLRRADVVVVGQLGRRSPRPRTSRAPGSLGRQRHALNAPQLPRLTSPRAGNGRGLVSSRTLRNRMRRDPHLTRYSAVC